MKDLTVQIKKFLDFIFLGNPQTEAITANGFRDMTDKTNPNSKALDNVMFGKGGSAASAAPVFVPPPAAPAATTATQTAALTPEEEEKRKAAALKAGAKSLQIPLVSGAPVSPATVGTGKVTPPKP
jgi:hypothetical protein